ncbi:MAG: energy transducer TonB [Myxococcota bacterium]
MLRSRSAARTAPVPSLLLAASFALLVVISSAGCRSMWDKVRENERTFALENARTNAKRGRCAAALGDLDRAEAIMAIDRFAIESLQIRLRCYDKLGLTELRAAHRRLLDDYYQDEPMAFPAADGSSVFRIKSGAPARFDRPPTWLKIARPRYTPYAQRSKIVGRVVVAFSLGPNGRTTNIHVVEMPHPLLATWAIEAVAGAKPARGMKDKVPVIESERVFMTTFNFEWRWADEPSEMNEVTPPSMMR